MQSHRSFKVKIVATNIPSGKQLTILNDTDPMTNVGRHIYHSLKLRMKPHQNKILKYNFVSFVSNCILLFAEPYVCIPIQLHTRLVPPPFFVLFFFLFSAEYGVVKCMPNCERRAYIFWHLIPTQIVMGSGVAQWLERRTRD